ncbi:hypothetical protein DFH07DRAFT_935547 [Mycena maculata]|uniref:Uncharacterized protein n=1 Tax=Mycena maculata TaxID=230809 RepID=A0AAD7KDA7_9AGAR|nr:hypothetical protein DFH07DRAFT_935547 [Mycena maculata]
MEQTAVNAVSLDDNVKNDQVAHGYLHILRGLDILEEEVKLLSPEEAAKILTEYEQKCSESKKMNSLSKVLDGLRDETSGGGIIPDQPSLDIQHVAFTTMSFLASLSMCLPHYILAQEITVIVHLLLHRDCSQAIRAITVRILSSQSSLDHANFENLSRRWAGCSGTVGALCTKHLFLDDPRQKIPHLHNRIKAGKTLPLGKLFITECKKDVNTAGGD